MNKNVEKEIPLCFICLDSCKTPGVLDHYCECNYIVHKVCFDKWYKIKKSCIICHEKCNPIKKYGTIVLKRKRTVKTNINIQINNGGILFWIFFLFFLKFYHFLNSDNLQNNGMSLEN